MAGPAPDPHNNQVRCRAHGNLIPNAPNAHRGAGFLDCLAVRPVNCNFIKAMILTGSEPGSGCCHEVPCVRRLQHHEGLSRHHRTTPTMLMISTTYTGLLRNQRAPEWSELRKVPAQHATVRAPGFRLENASHISSEHQCG